MKTKSFLFAFLTMVIATNASPVRKNLTGPLITVKEVSSFSADLSFFRTHRQGKGVSVNWGITSSEGVTGFIIQKTYEDPGDPYSMWEDVASVSCNALRSYKCEDENVYPGFISYRIIIVQSNGSKISSAVSTVHIVSRHG
ncbi:MAG: hypothetical protein JWM28_1853 [Chitinophagaceae bacterium]|nr:hypothetical protein [Chitinophagaceae bacterium]